MEKTAVDETEDSGVASGGTEENGGEDVSVTEMKTVIPPTRSLIEEAISDERSFTKLVLQAAKRLLRNQCSFWCSREALQLDVTPHDKPQPTLLWRLVEMHIAFHELPLEHRSEKTKVDEFLSESLQPFVENTRAFFADEEQLRAAEVYPIIAQCATGELPSDTHLFSVDGVPDLNWCLAVVRHASAEVIEVLTTDSAVAFASRHSITLNELLVRGSNNVFCTLSPWAPVLWSRPMYPRCPHVFQARLPFHYKAQDLITSILAAPELLLDHLEFPDERGKKLFFLMRGHASRVVVLFAVSGRDSEGISELMQMNDVRSSGDGWSAPLVLTCCLDEEVGAFILQKFDICERSADISLENTPMALPLELCLEELILQHHKCRLNDLPFDATCWKCPKPSHQHKLLRCNGCKRAFYCCKECQCSDWSRHKRYCKRIAQLESKQKVD